MVMSDHFKAASLSLDSKLSREFRAWEPYYPIGYPIQDGIHNPWVVIDPISGSTAYQVWQQLDKTPDPTVFKRKLAELGHGVDKQW